MGVIMRSCISLFIFISLLTASVGADVIPLTIQERAGVARVSDPVTFGIPFPYAAQFFNITTFGIYTNAGTPVPAQFRITGRWGGTAADNTKPIRWILVDFQADVAANGTAAYELRTTGSTEATSGISFTETGSAISVNTGAAIIAISKTSFNLFDCVTIGNDTIIASGASDGAVVTDGANIYRAKNSEATVTVEEQGYLRTVVLVEGAHGSHSDFTARIAFYANKSYAKVFYRVENNRQSGYDGMGQPVSIHNLGGANSANIDDLSLSIQLNAASGFTAYMQGNQAIRSTTADALVSLYQESSGLDNWDDHTSINDGGNLIRTSKYVTFRGYKITKGASSLETDNCAIGWLAASNGSRGALVACRDFWQQYPKAVRVSATGKVDIALLPDEFPQRFNLRPGEYKTNETFFYFYSGAKTQTELEDAAKAFNEPLFALAPTTWYAQSKAIQDFPEYLRSSAVWQDTAFEISMATVVDTNIGPTVWSMLAGNGSSLFQSIEGHNILGWQDFGDIPVDFECGRGQYGLKYHAGYGFLIQFLRSGDYRFWELGENGERHEGDMDIVHTGRDTLACYGNHCYWDGAYYGHSNHNECGDRNPHRNYSGGNYDIGYAQPGLFLYYFLSGNPWALEYAKENGEAYLRLQFFTETNGRATANVIRNLYEAWRATGDIRYRDAVEQVITDAIANSDYSGSATFSDFEFLKSIGLYIDYKEIITETEETSLRNEVLRLIDSLRADIFYDSAGFAASYGYYDWNRLVADMYAYAYKFNHDTADLNLADRLMSTGIAAQGPSVGCSPETWGPDLIFGPDGCRVIHYVGTKEAVNAVTMGMVYMAMRHPVEPYEPTKVEQSPGTSVFSVDCLPNPFNPAVKITITNYELPASLAKRGERMTNPEVKIFNVQGKLVEDLTYQIRNYSVVWDAKHFTSGVYFIKVRAGKGLCVKKVTLLR